MSYIPQSDSQNVLNASGVKINPATDESVILLRRMVKLLDSIATVDIQNRQKVNIDTINAGISIGVTQITPSLLQVTPVQATASSLQMTAAQPTATSLQMTANQATSANLNANVGSLGSVDARYQFIDAARTAYSMGIRANLKFS